MYAWTLDAIHFRIDVNGDGKTDDVYIYPPGHVVWTFLSEGNGQYQAETYSLGSGFDAGSGTWLTGDVNGDGKTDLIYSLGSGFDAGGGTWAITAFAPARPRPVTLPPCQETRPRRSPGGRQR
jgi:hypothetical protein